MKINYIFDNKYKKMNYIEGQNFSNINYIETPLVKGEFENCIFIGCIFSNTNLSGNSFEECRFEDCDLSMCKLNGTVFRDVNFKDCKLLGMNFEECNDFIVSFDFDCCILNFSSFYKLKIKNTHFKDCKLEETDFSESDLTNAMFENCDMGGAMFENTILEKSDFSTSHNYSVNPEINKIDKAKFSYPGLLGLLRKYDIVIE